MGGGEPGRADGGARALVRGCSRACSHGLADAASADARPRCTVHRAAQPAKSLTSTSNEALRPGTPTSTQLQEHGTSNAISDRSEEVTVDVKLYVVPRINYELRLETRAGSPLGVDPLIDPLGLGAPGR